MKLDLVHSFNTRDLGCVSNTVSINRHMLVRSDNTAYLDDKDIETLFNYGIRTIIDIRSCKEAQEEPDVTARSSLFRHVFIPFDCNDFAYNLSRNPRMLRCSLLDGYILLLEQKQTVFEIINGIYNSLLRGGVLYHCSGGKDRTGLISMLLLSILGANQDEILYDYHSTYECLKTSIAIQKWIEKYGEEYVVCNPSLMQGAIDYLNITYGSTEKYLMVCGIKKTVLQALKVLLIERKK